MGRWPDVEKLSVRYFGAALGVPVATRVPSDVETLPKFVQVIRGPGTDDRITDAPLLDVSAFALSPGDAWDLAEDAREAAHALSGNAVDGILVDSVTTSTAPTSVSYGNPKITRIVASYRLNLRKR